MQHITFVIGGMTRGGAERVISILANEYAKDGWNVDIIMFLTNSVDYKLDKNIRLIDLTGNFKNRVQNVPYWISSFRKYVKNEKPNIIVSFVARINVLVLIATLGLKSSVIVSERNDPARDGRSKMIDVATHFLYRKAKKVVFQTKYAKEYFRKQIQDTSVIISNPIVVTQKVQKRQKHKIVSVGRLAEQKNQKMLINAFAEVEKKYPYYQLWIYGEGNLRNELEEEIDRLSLSEKVFLPGNVSDIHVQISDAEMFILSSNYEGLSNALLEAMMMGLPSISTDCPGIREYIEDGVNGILVPIGDSQKLSSAILKLMENDLLRKNMGQRGMESVQKCERAFVIKEWKSVIEQIQK